MNWSKACATYLVPAAVFQSVIIGGGYGTGREIVEYVTRFGPTGGLIAIGVIATLFIAVLSTSFALASKFKLFNYRDFLKELLGPLWIVYEALFLLLLVLVLAIVASATTTLAESAFSIGPRVVWCVLTLTVLSFTFCGRSTVKIALTFWTLTLMCFLVALILQTMPLSSPLWPASTNPTDYNGAVLSGMQFAVYNSALIPVLMYAASAIESSSQAIKSGIIAGFFGTAPALLLHLGFIGFYPEINNVPVPTYYLVEQLNSTGAVYIYFLILIGTILLTAVGVLQGVNDRIDSWLREAGRNMLPNWARATSALGIILISLLLSQLGLINLIAKGYGALSWGFMIVFTLPLLTVGVRKLVKKD